MSADTKIEWATKTWGPIIGCEKVSDGCDRCYAVPQSWMRSFNPNPKIADAFEGTAGYNDDGQLDWTGRVNLLPARLAEPLGWKKPEKVFVNSLSDLFYKHVPTSFIARVLAVMALTPQHVYQVLTKRAARMRSVLTDGCMCGDGHTPGQHLRSAMAWAVSTANPDRIPGVPQDAEQRVRDAQWPLRNLWLGVSAEDQHWADIRIPALLDTPAAVRWISAEPLLGPIRLSAAWVDMPADARPVVLHDILGIGLPNRLDWVVAGGESGPGARPMHPDWARSLRDQCKGADVPFLFKQWGAWGIAPSNYGPYVPDRGRPNVELVFSQKSDIDGQIMLRAGKGRTGRLLDGVEHNGYPAVDR